MLRAFLAPGPSRPGRRSRLRQRSRAACGTATGARGRSGSTSARSSPTERAATSTCCSATCAGCRSPTARSPRRTRSTCSSTCRRRRCAGCSREAARVLAPGGTLFVYTHVRKNAPIAVGLRWINALARRLERVGLIDMRQERLRKSDHLNPLADIPELERVARATRLPHRADPLLHADRRRLRREHPDADGGAARWRGGRARRALGRMRRRRRGRSPRQSREGRATAGARRGSRAAGATTRAAARADAPR